MRIVDESPPGLSMKWSSRPFAPAQICINSLSRAKTGEFVGAAYDDHVDFFEGYRPSDKEDEYLIRIKEVLSRIDASFR